MSVYIYLYNISSFLAGELSSVLCQQWGLESRSSTTHHRGHWCSVQWGLHHGGKHIEAFQGTKVNFTYILRAAFAPIFFCQKSTKPNSI